MLADQKRRMAACDQLFVLANAALQLVPNAYQPRAQDGERREDDDCRETAAHAEFLPGASNGCNAMTRLSTSLGIGGIRYGEVASRTRDALSTKLKARSKL